MKAHRTNRRNATTRLAYQQRVQAQFGALKAALDSGASVAEAAQQAGMDVMIVKMYCRLPRTDWPDAQ